MNPYWDDLSMLLYVLMGIVGMTSLKMALDFRESNRTKSLSFLAFGIVVWTVFASFRTVGY